eukprot:TRINITY_DN2246_c0_g7_i1.p2 TRINITY_DN2246_c0_g7~~TRINITY_DN2246_c0_g7_i1.p2  ORF type:complete len:110 (+),score=15.61 TRINITY_DN2246_c0_g7_i1:190-519(+)
MCRTPVKLPGATKNRPSFAITLGTYVFPYTSTSHPSSFLTAASDSRSPQGQTWCPCVRPMQRSPSCTRRVSGKSSSHSPLVKRAFAGEVDRDVIQALVLEFPTLPVHRT